ncbi:uncharacterized protein V6R79_001257 [Siganus canaliculatus]
MQLFQFVILRTDSGGEKRRRRRRRRRKRRRSYLNQPRSEADVSRSAALRSPPALPVTGEAQNPPRAASVSRPPNGIKYFSFFAGNPQGGTRGFTALNAEDKGFLKT